MKQLVQSLKNEGTILIDSEIPKVSRGKLLIKTISSLVSTGTEKMLVDFGAAGYINKARQQPDKVKQVIEKIKTDGVAATFDAVKTKLDMPIQLGYCNVGKVCEVGNGVKGFEIGDIVVVDLGARVNDWVSDITRTYSVGPTTNETIIEVYMTVYDAQNVTFPVIEAGTPAWLIDDLARTHITEQGYGEYFIHSTGHGYGVCVHEPPLLSSGTDDPLFGLSYNQQPLAVWDAITIEPGIYLDGWFGVRIEDDVLVNDKKPEVLSIAALKEISDLEF